MEPHKKSALVMYLSQRGFNNITAEMLGEPFAGFKDFDDCVSKNRDKDDPQAFCATVMRKVEGEIAETIQLSHNMSCHFPNCNAIAEVHIRDEDFEISIGDQDSLIFEQVDLVPIHDPTMSKQIAQMIAEHHTARDNLAKELGDGWSAEESRTAEIEGVMLHGHTDLINHNLKRIIEIKPKINKKVKEQLALYKLLYPDYELYVHSYKDKLTKKALLELDDAVAHFRDRVRKLRERIRRSNVNELEELNKIGEPIQIFESIADLQKHDFAWAPDIERLKRIAETGKGKILFIKALHPMITDPFNVGHGAREYTVEEMQKSARTAIGHSLNINHIIRLEPKFMHKILDGEFNEKNNTLEYLVYEEDPEILRLLNEKLITYVSMQGDARRKPMVCDKCGTKECNCRVKPEGIVWGENSSDGAAMAYVVNKKGATYYGQPIVPAPPGDWNSIIQIAETNNSLSTGSTQCCPMKEKLIEAAKKLKQSDKLLEAINSPDKFLTVKETLDQYNEAVKSGDLVQAMMILSNEVFQKGVKEAEHQDDCPPGFHKVDDKCVPMEETLKPIAEAVMKQIEPKIAEVKKDLDSMKESVKNASARTEEVLREVNKAKAARPAMTETNSSRKELDIETKKRIAEAIPVN